MGSLGALNPGTSGTGSVGAVMDPFERLLTSLVEHMMMAWQLEEHQESALGELAAEAAAVLQFYRERASTSPQVTVRATPPQHEAVELKAGKAQKGYHWSDTWRQDHGE